MNRTSKISVKTGKYARLLMQPNVHETVNNVAKTTVSVHRRHMNHAKSYAIRNNKKYIFKSNFTILLINRFLLQLVLDLNFASPSSDNA